MFARGLLAGAMLWAAGAGAAGTGWVVEPDFKNASAAKQISGASCPNTAVRQDWCIVVNDEKKYIQFFELDARRITPVARMRVMAKTDGTGRKQDEPDLEAIAREGRYVYVTGSHGAPRRGKPVQPSRFHVFRFPVDAKTGRPGFEVSRKKLTNEIETSTRLGPAIAEVPALTQLAGKQLSENGVTIEGLGARDGQLFFGLRTPVDQDGAFVLETSADALFSNKTFELTSHRVQLGDGYGIRAIERFRDAFLLLAGTGYGPEMQAVIWIWKPGHAAVRVAEPEVPTGWKAEGLMLLSDDADRGVRVLVFFDGQKNGSPVAFTLPIQ